jgi:putative ATPase
MLEGGEDPKFIARRMIIFASEDIGMAQPTALVVANEVFKTCEIIGYPECAINLAHGTVYLASAKKDRSAYDAYARAREDVLNFPNEPIPLHLRNAPTKLMKNLGYAKDYSWKEGNVGAKEGLSYLPEKLKGRKYYKK